MWRSSASFFRVQRFQNLGLWLLTVLAVSATWTFVLPTHSAIAQVDCTGGVTFDKGDGNEQLWYFDTTAGTCSNAGPNPVDGFTLITDDTLLALDEAFDGGVATWIGLAPPSVTANNIAPQPNYTSYGPNGLGFFEVGLNTNATFTSVVTLTFQGVGYTININHSTFVGDHRVTSMVITGGAFVPPALPVAATSLAPQALSQQIAGSSIFMNQAGRAISVGVGRAIAERFFAGDGTNLDVASNGSALSAYVSLRGLEADTRARRARRLAMYNADDGALNAIESAVSDDAPGEAETLSHGSLGALSYAAEDGAMPTLANEPSNQVNSWARGSFTHHEGRTFSGSTWNGIIGLDYRVTNSLLLGILGGYERGELSFHTPNGAFDGSGFTVGAYVGLQLADTLVADAFLTHTWLTYDNLVGTVLGSIDAQRTMVSFNLTGRYAVTDNLVIEPNVRAFYAHERQDGYRLSDATLVPSNRIDAGQLSVGPTMRYRFTGTDDDQWSVFVSTHLEYDLSSENQTNTLLHDLDDVLSARVGFGLDAAFSSGWSISLAGDIGGIGADGYSSYSGSGQLNIPLYW